jgi:hypothetical protein
MAPGVILGSGWTEYKKKRILCQDNRPPVSLGSPMKPHVAGAVPCQGERTDHGTLNQSTVCGTILGHWNSVYQEKEVSLQDRLMGEFRLAKGLRAHVTVASEVLKHVDDLADKQGKQGIANEVINALNAEQNLRRVMELQQSKISSASDLDSATALAEQAAPRSKPPSGRSHRAIETEHQRDRHYCGNRKLAQHNRLWKGCRNSGRRNAHGK